MIHKLKYTGLLVAGLIISRVSPIMAQEYSRCATIVSGRDTLRSNIYYFTRSAEIRLLAPGPGTIFRYTLDGSEPQASSPIYSRPLLLSSTAELNYLSIEAGRKETLCPSLHLRRIEGMESIALSAENLTMTNGPLLGLLDTARSEKITLPSNLNQVTLLVNQGVVAGADSILLILPPDNFGDIRKIEVHLSDEGKNYYKPRSNFFKSAQILRQKSLTLFPGSLAFRYLKITLHLKKAKKGQSRLLPIEGIKIFTRLEK
ncbi:MAG: chitobiase/beta-hexosaminidase C-terminal domain-containing protein [Bacteroidales bacterium]|nr:hypothetical protein [Bacteroidales bacterium]NPV37102.1 chitobiase/beta-hexosaminidase C-terminal domain-containing protein [Bacteroidales bacterium]